MKKQPLLHILLVVMTLTATLTATLTSCDVHEFPVETGARIPVQLHLDFSTELPLYKELIYSTRSTENVEDVESIEAARDDIRYIIHAYRNGTTRSGERQPDTVITITRPTSTTLDYTTCLELPEGDYTIRVWSDRVESGSQSDKYYQTPDFSNITRAAQNPYTACTDNLDAYRGTATCTVVDTERYPTGTFAEEEVNTVTVPMQRPLGKYTLISTDLEAFITRLGEMQKEGRLDQSPIPDGAVNNEQTIQTFDPADYVLHIRYISNINSSYNHYIDKPCDLWSGIEYESTPELTEEGEVTIGYDYHFVNGSESTLLLQVEVLTRSGISISRTNTFEVPLLRSRHTIVRGEFLTGTTGGGVSIETGYNENDYNYEFK